MPKAADGEFELVLENRQVMTAFFVVVILCGIFFGLGYIVGKNTMQPVQAKEEAGPVTDVKESAMKAEKKELPVQTETASDMSFSKDLAGKNPEQPKLEASQPPAPAAAPAPTTVAHSQPMPAPPSPKPVAAPATTAASAATAAHILLQVAATKSRDDADNTANLLRGKGFSVHTELKSDGLYHVLVTSSDAESETTKAKLVQAGFKPFKKS